MIVSIIQARMGSSRLPKKVMLDLLGESVLFRVYERVVRSSLIDKSIIATGISTENNIIEEFCKSKSINVYKGSEDDVLDRYYQTARSLDLSLSDAVVRITADCPLIDPEIIDKVIKAYLSNGADYASNTNPPTYPDGLDVEVISFYALEKAWREAKLKSEREHVTPYIKKNTEMFRHVKVSNSIDLSKLRWTLDELEDYKFIDLVYNYLYKGENNFLMEDVLELVNSHPELNKINDRFIRDEGYKRSLLNDMEVK